MNNYIFDREKDELMRDEDGVKISYKTHNEVWDYLENTCQFKPDWIKANFFIMMGVKLLEPDNEYD